MAGVEGVVGALIALGKAAEAAELPQGLEAVPAPGEEFVGIGLMAHIPDDLVRGAVKDVVQGDGEFHRPQAGGQMPAGLGHGGNDLLPDLLRQLRQQFRRQFFQILRTIDVIQQPAAFRVFIHVLHPLDLYLYQKTAGKSLFLFD